MLKEKNICFKEISSFSRLISYATFYGLLLKLFVFLCQRNERLKQQTCQQVMSFCYAIC